MIGFAIAIVLVSNYRQNTVLMLFNALMMISVCWQIAKIIGENRILTWVSRHNFTIYIYSWPFQAVTMVVCEKIGFPWFVTTSCMFIVGLLLPIVVLCIYEHFIRIQNRFFDILLGVK